MLNKLKITVLSGVLALFMVGCAGANANKGAVASKVKAISGNENIYISATVPYKEVKNINIKIRQECAINTQMVTYLVKYGAKNGINFIVSNNPKKSDKVLKLTIDDAVSAGNAFRGHKKFVSISGEIKQNGKVISSFRAARKSGGGFMGRYKSSCAVLGGAVKRLARDTAEWAVTKQNKATLGDSHLLKY